MFDRVSKEIDFARIEEEILALWDREQTFRRSVEERDPAKSYVFYDGPPFATGLPHYGHLLAGTLKDIIPRFWTMRGYRVERRFGWDCHGLPVEMEIEKDLGLSGRASIIDYGVDRFNEACRSIVLKYTAQWEKTVRRMGRWVDFVNDYKTMDPSFMESVWWAFQQLWQRGLIYEGYKVMPYSWRAGTPLSNFEANLNYKEVSDPAITLRFAIDGHPGAYFLAWTTTPWTLPGNLALAVGPDIDYVWVEDEAEGVQFVLAEARLPVYYPQGSGPRLIRRLKGRELVGMRYAPLFPFFASEQDRGAFRVIPGGFVSTEDGTGIVHIAPAYGEEDFEACREAGITLVDPVDENGAFTAAVPPWAGMNVKEADPQIIQRLKEEGKLIHRGKIKHSYPFCWRTETPLIYKAISTWFVKVTALRDRMVELNRQIRWVPDYVGERRFSNWIKDARDWAISRNRFWGTPIPIWRCDAEGCDHTQVVGSIAELEGLAGCPVTDLHKHRIDPLSWPCPGCGQGTMRRVPEVLDCWFESGSMPYAEAHYPFERAEEWSRRFPAEFIAEGLDQTRGWFYTLLVLSTALFDQPPFRNVVVNGLILAEDGLKMSKSLKNYPDPEEVIGKYGADSLRAYLINSPVVRAEPLRFSEEGIRKLLRAVMLPFWNSYSFFVTYANVDGWDPKAPQPPVAGRSELDRWILSVLQSLVRDVLVEMEAYRLYNVIPRLVSFIDDLTNWYIRRSRRRFWKEGMGPEKQGAYATLHEVLTTFVRLLAPFMPFLTEAIYQNLVRHAGLEAADSVHLTSYPEVRTELLDPELEQRVALVRQVVSLGRAVRERHAIKTRQPLPLVTVVSTNAPLLEAVQRMAELVADELNVKRVATSADESALVDRQAKANFKTLGRRFGKSMGEAARSIQELGPEQIERLLGGGTIEVLGQTLAAEDVLITRQPRPGLEIATEGEVTVALDTRISEELRQEGIARELVNRLNNLRKSLGYEVDDRVTVRYRTEEAALAQAIAAQREAICDEVLALALEEAAPGEPGEDLEVEGAVVRVSVAKVA